MQHIKKEPTALICLSHHIGGMELAATKLAKVLSNYIDITYIIKKILLYMMSVKITRIIKS
jgi:hypothetical protein